MDAERARQSLSEFIRQAWHVLEPGTELEWNWHIDVIADHVQAVLEDWIANQEAKLAKQEPPEARAQNLVINVPPGTAKSRIVSVMATAWMWTRWPSWRVICLSANPRVAIRDSLYTRQIVESEWFADTFRPTWKLTRDQNAKSLFKNTEGGFRQALGFNAKITGDRADALIWDDPHDAKDVKSDTKRKGVLEKYDHSMGNRVNDLRCSVRIGIMQRLHEADLTGHVLAQGEYRHLCLAMEKEAKPACKCADCQSGQTFLGWVDTRAEGEVLHPTRFTVKVLTGEKTRLGLYGYAGQMQQRPAPADGVILKRSHWRYYRVLPEDIEEIVQSWDMTFKETSSSDFVCGQVWGRKGANKYLIDQAYGRMDFAATCNALVALHQKYPKARAILIEEAANGPAVMSALASKVPGLIGMKPQQMGDKKARAWAVQPEQEAGNFFLPALSLPTGSQGDPVLEPWVEAFVDECAAFPNAVNDDRVDAFTQMGIRFQQKREARMG